MKNVAAIVGSHDVGEVVDHCTANAVDNSAKLTRLVHQSFSSLIEALSCNSGEQERDSASERGRDAAPELS